MPRIRPGRRGPLIAVGALTAFGFAASADYVIQPGDTLSEIAVAQGVSSAQLADANGLAEPDRILHGRTLTLPGATETDDDAPADTTSAEADSAATVETAAAETPALTQAEVGELLERTANDHGWSPAFVKAIAWQESGWNQSVVSSAGAVGIMQVMPETGQFVSTNLAGRQLDLSDPEDNVLAGVLFLDYLYGLTGGDAVWTLKGYYQGLASARHIGPYLDTEQYVDSVLALRERFR